MNHMMMRGGEGEGKLAVACKVLAVVLVLVVIGLVIALIVKSPFDPSVTDYDCDIRIGCNTRDLTNRSMTNIQLQKQRAKEVAMLGKENFNFADYQPGVDRPQISHLINSEKLRFLNDNMSNRINSDFVFTQFGNDGTVINPNDNPLMRPLLSTGSSLANMKY